MMRKLYGAALVGLVAAGFSGCLFPDLSDFQTGGAGSGAGNPGGAGPGSGAGDASGGSSPTSSGPSGGSGAGGKLGACELTSAQKGAKGIKNPGAHVSGRCFAITETSFAEYDQFLEAAGYYSSDPSDYMPVAAEISDVCGWKDAAKKMAYVPLDYGSYDAARPTSNDRPVESVDWCDAWMYCHWAGKGLCGGTDGKPTADRTSAWEKRTEWYEACQGDQPIPNTSACYPTLSGNAYEMTEPVTSCLGHGGLYNMLSDVWEWEDNCVHTDGTDGSMDDCRYRGQTDRTADGGLPDCDWPNNDMPSPRNNPGYGVGIRCCWDQNK